MHVSSLVVTDDQRVYFADIGYGKPLPAAPSEACLALIEQIESGEIEPVLRLSPAGELKADTDNENMFLALHFLRWSLIKVTMVTNEGSRVEGIPNRLRRQRWGVPARRPGTVIREIEPTEGYPEPPEEEDED